MPGLANSSPIVWGGRVFVTSAVSSNTDPYHRVGLYGESPKHEEKVEHDYRVYCLDKKSGSILWEKSAHRGIPKALRHIKATHANCTPATDGRHVVAFFGSEGLYCFDFDGTLIWKKDLGFLDSGPPRAADLQWGFASSPVIYDGKVIVLCAVRGESFLAGHADDGQRASRAYYYAWGLAYYLAFEQGVLVAGDFEAYLDPAQGEMSPVERFEQLVGQPLEQFEPKWRAAMLAPTPLRSQ